MSRGAAAAWRAAASTNHASSAPLPLPPPTGALTNAGAPVDAPNRVGHSALLDAVYEHRRHAVAFLSEAGADPHRADAHLADLSQMRVGKGSCADLFKNDSGFVRPTPQPVGALMTAAARDGELEGMMGGRSAQLPLRRARGYEAGEGVGTPGRSFEGSRNGEQAARSRVSITRAFLADIIRDAIRRSRVGAGRTLEGSRARLMGTSVR